MGLDIGFHTDIDDEVFNAEYYSSENFRRHKFHLSRSFCNFMCRKGLVGHNTELDQIGRLTTIDIAPLHEMNSITGQEELNFLLEVNESEEQKQKLIAMAGQQKERIRGNIKIVLQLVDRLIVQLSGINNLPKLLDDQGNDTIGYNDYFTSFDKDKGDGYIGNNFGQDLRNFKRFLEYAISKGATTVYFTYG